MNPIEEAVRETKGAAPVFFVSITIPKMLAKHPVTGNPNPYRNTVRKVSHVRAFVGAIYERSKNRDLERNGQEPDFVASPRTWGTHDPDCRCIIHHKGEKYIEVKIEGATSEYNDTDGNPLAADYVEYMTPRPDRGNVVFVTYKLNSIAELHINKTIIINPDREL